MLGVVTGVSAAGDTVGKTGDWELVCWHRLRGKSIICSSTFNTTDMGGFCYQGRGKNEFISDLVCQAFEVVFTSPKGFI